MVSWMVLCAVLGAGVDVPAKPRRVVVTPAPRPAEVAPETVVPDPPTVSDDARVRQFLGALGGGTLGIAAALLLFHVTGAGRECSGGGSCSIEASSLLLGVLPPLLAATGAWAGHRLLGGDGGWLTAFVATAPALLFGLGMLGVASYQRIDTAEGFWPALIASGAMMAGGSALALHLRARDLEALGSSSAAASATEGRVALTAVVGVFSLAAAGGLSALALLTDPGSTGGIVLATILGLSGVAGSTAAVWGMHRALGGRGSIGAALAGMGAIAAALVATSGLAALSTTGGLTFVAGNVVALDVLVMAIAFAPVVALELSHTAKVATSAPRLAFSAAPVAGGAMVGAALRF